MKSFFKKVALVLALAMVVTMMPAKTVSAADAPWMKKSMTLYIEGDAGTGEYDDTAYAKVKYDKTAYTVAFESDEPAVATVGPKKGLVTAQSVGNATITATFTDKNGKVAVTKTCKVTVKRNAADAGISDASAAKLEEGLTVGETFTVESYRTTSDGKTISEGTDVITDSVRFKSSDPKVFKVSKLTGEITPVAPGEATLEVYAVQREGVTKNEDGKLVDAKGNIVTDYPKTTESNSYTVNVVAGEPVVSDAKVTAVRTIELSVKNVDAENVGTLKVWNNAIGSLGGDITTLFTSTLSEDGTTVTLTKSFNLVNDEELTFGFGDGEKFTYTVKIGEPHAIILEPFNAQTLVPTDIKCKVVDENGVALDVSNNVFFELAGDYAYTATIDSTKNPNQITMYEVGKVVTLKASYNTGKWDNTTYEQIFLRAETNVACVEFVPATVSDAKFMIGYEAGKDYNKDKLSNEATIQLGATAGRIYAAVILDNNSIVDSANNAGFTFESLSPTILVVNPANGDLSPVATGLAMILVRYDNGGIKRQFVATIRVVDNSSLTSIAVDGNAQTISNSADVDQKAVITIKGLDQYNNARGLSSNVGITQKSGNVVSLTSALDDGKVKLTFAGSSVAKGDYIYEVKVADTAYSWITKTINVKVSVAEGTGNIVSYRFDIGGKEINPATISSSDFAQVPFRVIGYNGSGIAVSVATATEISIKNNSNGAEGVVTSNGNGYTVDFATEAQAVSGSAVVVKVDGSQKYYNVKTGTFTVNAKVDGRSVIPAQITISIKAAAPAWELRDGTTSINDTTVSSYQNAILAKFKIANDDARFTDQFFVGGDIVDSIKTGTTGTFSVYVRNIRVYEKLKDGDTETDNYVLHTIPVNKSFSVRITGD